MDVLGFGGSEVLVILLLAGLVLGPERMVRVAREIGNLVRNVKAYLQSFNEELKAELDILDDVKAIRKEL